MRREDFIKYGEFIFGVLFEFDRRQNLKNDKDVKNLIISEIKRTRKRSSVNYQSRQEGFIMERIANIFYDYHFKKILYIPIRRQ